MSKQFTMTQETYDKLTQEMEYLKTVREKEVADQIKEARSFGDLSENSEYDEAKNEQGKLYSRMAELEVIIAGAVIVDEDSIQKDVVSHGSTVSVRMVGDDEIEQYRIVGSQEVDLSKNCISDESPIGRALLGRKVGEIVQVEAPMGKFDYELLSIS